MAYHKPGSVDGTVFGRLNWEERLDWWVGSVEFAPGHRIDIFVIHDVDAGQPADEIAAARRRFVQVREREPEYRRWSASQLLAGRWNTEAPMAAADIAGLLRVASLEFECGGVRIFWDDQDKLFGGHNVVTDIGPDGECMASGMQQGPGNWVGGVHGGAPVGGGAERSRRDRKRFITKTIPLRPARPRWPSAASRSRACRPG